MYFRHQHHDPKPKNISNLENQILEKGSLLHECCVKKSKIIPNTYCTKTWGKVLEQLLPTFNFLYFRMFFDIFWLFSINCKSRLTCHAIIELRVEWHFVSKVSWFIFSIIIRFLQKVWSMGTSVNYLYRIFSGFWLPL